MKACPSTSSGTGTLPVRDVDACIDVSQLHVASAPFTLSRPFLKTSKSCTVQHICNFLHIASTQGNDAGARNPMIWSAEGVM